MISATPNTSIFRILKILIFSLLIIGSASAQPRITFDTLEYTMAPVKKGAPASLNIPFRNTGDQPLIITSARGQGAPSISRPLDPIPPNGEGVLLFKMPTDFAGTTRQTVMVGTNIDDKIIVLSIKVTVYDVERRRVSGVVTDSLTGLPMMNVWVSVLTDRTRYAETDPEGNYTIMAAPDESLMFRLEGMKGKIVKADQVEVNAALQDSGLGFRAREKMKSDVALSHTKVSVKDLNNANNPRYQFKRSSTTNVYVLYISSLPALSDIDVSFQQTYKIVYNPYADHKPQYLRRYNRLVFKYLSKKYGKAWQEHVRKDAIGLDDFLK
ncbi:DUF1573 domain-containing protein [Flavobacterium sp.]|uniref:FEKKY domain-containing protein n=1 Tax=Flavobacterium sp. TaxID=239 RepID=UPI0026376ED5|nr:DUF1573 domain-containing protein [Flavobacterium sp.]